MSSAAADQGPAVGLDSIYRTVEQVGDAWSWLVMREALLYDVRRFTQFQARLGVARSTLAARLGQLTSGGLLVERPRAPGPEYHPTASGRDFLACLMVAMRWGDRWCFDQRSHPASALHLGCGQPLEAVLRCSKCHDVVTAQAVAACRPGPFTASTSFRLRRRTPDLSLLERTRNCSIARTLGVIGDNWTGLLIREAFFGTRRFDDFQRNLAIAPNILSGRLRRLVEQDILVKAPYDDWPVRHDYRLTERGLDLYHVPLAVLTWGQRWLHTEESDIRLTHTTCSSQLLAVLSCERCGDTLTRDEIHLR
ncbi:MAG: winged helix-turn-helix transcriptional regulator [Ilumatobacteraceae bacterium]